jgi:hypothetical protein
MVVLQTIRISELPTQYVPIKLHLGHIFTLSDIRPTFKVSVYKHIWQNKKESLFLAT